MRRQGGDEFGIVLVRCGGEAAPLGLVARLHDVSAEKSWLLDGVTLGYQSLRKTTSATEALHLADLATLTDTRSRRQPGR